ncbi:MAG: tetratricopeptide repeat protein [Candidatus Omnitrophota bacterium]
MEYRTSPNKNVFIYDFFLKNLRPYFWISALSFLLYSKALSFGYSYLDDNVLILNSHQFISKLSNIFETFRIPDIVSKHSYYRPLLTVSLILDAQFGGKELFFYHLSNVIFHIIASSLVFKLLTKMGYSRGVSLFFGLVFCSHPALANPVVWIPGRADVILAIFSLGAFIFFLDFLKTQNRLAFLGHLVFFSLALLSRENALAIPIVCVCYLLLIEKERTFSLRQGFLAAGWALVILLWFFLREAVLTEQLHYSVVNAAKSLFMGIPALVQYFGKAVFPFNLSVLPNIKDTTFVWGLSALFLLVFALLFSKDKRTRFIIFGAIWFLIFLSLCFIKPSADVSANFLEHRLYPAFFGLVLVFLEIDFIKRLEFRRPAAVFIGALFLLFFSGITFTYSENYRDRIKFWNNAVKTSPQSPLAHKNLGAMYYLDGLMDKAETEYKKSLQLNPMEPMVHNNLGLIYAKRGKLNEAEAEYKKEITINPEYDDVYFNLGLLYYGQGKTKEAERLWRKTLQINPDYPGIRYN